MSEVDTTYWHFFNDRVFETVNPLPFDPKKYSPAKLDNETILWLGRISDEKNPLDALKIFNEVHGQLSNSKLIIVGDGDQAIIESMHKYVSKQKLENCVEFMGFQSDVIPFYYSASVFLCTSEYEGFLLTLAEALSTGVPCVLYELPYLKMTRAQQGIIQVPQKDIHLAADSILNLLLNKNKLQKLGAEGKRYIEKLSEYNYIAFWNNTFNSVSEKQILKKNSEDIELMWRTLFDFYSLGVKRNSNNISKLKKDSGGFKLDSPQGIQNVGRAYVSGEVVSKNLNCAAEWMGKAYSLSDKWVNEYIAVLWELKTEDSLDTLKHICEKEIQKNNPLAFRALARYYTDIDCTKTILYYEKALELNPEYVLFEYTNLLFKSTNASDITKCIEICLKYAEQDNKDALYRLGCIYYSGKGVKTDYYLSKQYFTRAAELGSNLAKKELSSKEFPIKRKLFMSLRKH